MPPKRGSGGSSAKTPTHARTKRSRLSDDTESQGVTVTTSTATAAFASSTPLGDLSVEDDPALMVDYDESTPLPSPQRGDEDSELMRHCDDDAILIAAASQVPVAADLPNVAVASQPTVNKAVIASSKDSPQSQGVTCLDDLEQKAPPTALKRVQSVPLARRLEGGYGSRTIPAMPPPSEWPRADGSTAPLLARATLDAHNYYGVFRQWKSQGKTLGRISPIPVVLFPNETTDEYETAFLRRIAPHPEAAKQRSQRISFALERAQKIAGKAITPISRNVAPASPVGLSGAAGAGAPARKRQPAQGHRRAGRQLAPRSQNSGDARASERGFGVSPVPGGGQPTFPQGGVGSQLHQLAPAAPDRCVDLAHLFAAHASTVQTQAQAQSAAVDGRVAALESQVVQLTSKLDKARAKARQGYDRLKSRVDALERAMLNDARFARCLPRSPSPRQGGGGSPAGSYPSSRSNSPQRRSTHGRRHHRSR